MFDLAALNAELAGTPFAGNLHFAPVTGSTNSDALVAARNGAPHGSVYLTDEQTAGRGRSDHGWHSAPGEGLYVSVLLRPQFPSARLPLLPLAIGLAASDAIQSTTGLTPDLRWPNDLLIGPRKLCGILVESQLSSSSAGRAIVAGIGINVHQREFPPDLATPATSLDLELGRRISRQQLLAALLRSQLRELEFLTDSDAPHPLLARVEQASTWICGRHVFVHGPQACQGITAGLDPNGFLLVETASGRVTVQTGGLRAAE